MNVLKTRRGAPRLRLSLPLTLLAAVLLSGGITLLCLWIQPNSLRAVLAVFRAQPLLIVLNALPIGLLVLACACLFRNVFASAALVGSCCALLSAANRIKLEVRDEPVFPRDFALLREVGSAAGAYAIRWPWGVLAVIAVFLLVMLVCARLVGCQPFPLARARNWGGRLLGALASLAALTALILTVYASNGLYNSFAVSNPYYVPAVFNELGFPYCFCHHFTTYTVEKPQGYSRAEAEGWETGDASGQGENVHVILVMNEAFSDLTDQDVFRWAEGDDPLRNLHALQADAHCVSGRVVVPGFAGGTANTEFDVLTGMQTNALSSASTTSAFRAVNRNLDSLFRVFGGDGYRTLFMHPGYDWFYNRENVYRWLGAEESLFIDDFPDAEYKGSWVTDDYMAGQIERQFESAVAGGETLFNYTVTIQNHMSYTAGKYGEGYGFPPVETAVPVSDAVETMLSVYTEGVRDADAMLGRLTAYFSRTEEPVVLAFFGDHLPDLGDAQMGYRELGLEMAKDERLRADPFSAYETPYVLWANDAAAETLGWDDAVSALELPEDGTLSACYLGAAVLELTGRGGESAWFSYLAELRRQLPVIQKEDCRLSDGSVTSQDGLSGELQDRIAQLRRWSYYKLKAKDVG